MNAPIRGGGGSLSTGPVPASSTRPLSLVMSALFVWAGTTPCAAQPAPSSLPAGGGISPGAMSSAPSSSSGMGGPSGATGARAPLGGLSTIPGAPGAGATGPSLGGPAAMPGNLGAGSMPTEPTWMPMRADSEPPPPGPMPLAAAVPLPTLSHDRYGDGSGTVGSLLVWLGQLP